MAKSQIPVVGEPFKGYVNGQIVARQKMYGSGFNRTRTAQEMSYLNSNTTWVKMASSVDISKLYDGKQRLKNLGLGGDYAKADHLAKQAVLFNGLTPLNGNMRAGVAQSNSLINSSAFGFGGTEFGLKPLPGITSIDVTPVNRGSIKQATVNIKAYNKFQFELIETLYLRLGFTIMLEWGNSIYVDNKNNFQKTDTTLIENFFFKGNGTHLEVLNRIEKERSDKFGNYDALFARVVNFDWTFQPDGSYDISIKLTSLGDVIESFKVNVLAPRTVIDEFQLSKKSASEGGDITDDNVNKNSISNFLYIIKSQYTDEDFRNKKNGLLKIDSSLGSSDSSPIEQRLYIRLGTLLEYIQKEILTFFTNGVGSGCFPLVYINTSSDCVMKAKPKLISVEPQTCIIKPNFTLMGIEYPEWAENMTPFFADSTGNGNLGFIHDIYLNFNFIEKLLQSNTDKEGNISLYSFITAILGGINKSLSNVCDLEITVNADQNQIIIRDQKLTPRLTKDGMLAEGKKSTIIEVMGFKGGKDKDSENISYTSNFVKNFSFKTQITSKLSSMLSIGATANNNSLNEDATAFSKWNMGLIDRFQQKITDGTPDGCKVEECVEEEDQIVTLVIEKPLSWFERLNEWEKLRQQNLVKEQERSDNIAKNYNNTLESYFNASFADEYKHLRGVYQEVFSDKDKLDIKTYDGKKYFQNDPDFVEKGKSILKNYITSDDIDTSVKSKKPSSNIGFIPIELSLDIIGMSGIKIYNQLRLNTDFLPYNYDETMEFVVMGLGHKVDSSGWTTTISAIGKPKSTPLKKETDRRTFGV